MRGFESSELLLMRHADYVESWPRAFANFIRISIVSLLPIERIELLGYHRDTTIQS